MSLPLHFHPHFFTDLCQAKCWLDKQQLGRGELLEAAVYRTVSAVSAAPEAFACIRGSYRRARVKGFKFGLLFAYIDGRILVVGLPHDSQDLDTFLQRDPP